jgi:hypothetical protein
VLHELVYYAISIILALAIYAVRRAGQSDRAAEQYRRAAKELGLERRWDRNKGSWNLAGTVDGLTVTVEEVLFRGQSSTRIAVDAHGRIPVGLTLTTGGTRQPTRCVTTGDERFDAVVSVRGDEREALAVLTEPAREAVARWLPTTLESHVANGIVECREPGEESERLAAEVRRAVEVAKVLSLEGKPARRLKANATRDPKRKVRLRNLEVLARQYAGKRVRLNALRRALKSADPEARVFAVLELGPESLEFVFPVVTEDRDPHVRAVALLQLAAFAGERLWPAIEIALRSRDEEVRTAAVVAAGMTHHVAMLHRIADEVDNAGPVTAGAVALALGELGDPTAERTLVKLLAHDSVAVKCAAAKALDRVGMVTAVEPLLAASEGLFTDGELKRAASRAVASIRSRLGNVDAGRLSLVEQEAGALSLTEDRERADASDDDSSHRSRG